MEKMSALAKLPSEVDTHAKETEPQPTLSIAGGASATKSMDIPLETKEEAMLNKDEDATPSTEESSDNVEQMGDEADNNKFTDDEEMAESDINPVEDTPSNASSAMEIFFESSDEEPEIRLNQSDQISETDSVVASVDMSDGQPDVGQHIYDDENNEDAIEMGETEETLPKEDESSIDDISEHVPSEDLNDDEMSDTADEVPGIDVLNGEVRNKDDSEEYTESVGMAVNETSIVSQEETKVQRRSTRLRKCVQRYSP